MQRPHAQTHRQFQLVLVMIKPRQTAAATRRASAPIRCNECSEPAQIANQTRQCPLMQKARIEAPTSSAARCRRPSPHELTATQTTDAIMGLRSDITLKTKPSQWSGSRPTPEQERNIRRAAMRPPAHPGNDPAALHQQFSTAPKAAQPPNRVHHTEPCKS